jgi:hypothetical protein
VCVYLPLMYIATIVRSTCRWLYCLNLTIDANFRLKNKARVENDPPLGDGWGHWVPEQPYQLYLNQYGYQTEVRMSKYL